MENGSDPFDEVREDHEGDFQRLMEQGLRTKQSPQRRISNKVLEKIGAPTFPQDTISKKHRYSFWHLFDDAIAHRRNSLGKRLSPIFRIMTEARKTYVETEIKLRRVLRKRQ